MSLRRDLPAIGLESLRASAPLVVGAMSRRTGAFTQSDVTRAIKAAKAAGVEIGKVEVDRAGRIAIVPLTAMPPAAADDLDSELREFVERHGQD